MCARARVCVCVQIHVREVRKGASHDVVLSDSSSEEDRSSTHARARTHARTRTQTHTQTHTHTHTHTICGGRGRDVAYYGVDEDEDLAPFFRVRPGYGGRPIDKRACILRERCIRARAPARVCVICTRVCSRTSRPLLDCADYAPPPLCRLRARRAIARLRITCAPQPCARVCACVRTPEQQPPDALHTAMTAVAMRLGCRN